MDERPYDIGAYLNDHPGGRDILLSYIDDDATLVFEEVAHTQYAQSQRERFLFHIPGPALMEPFQAWYRLARCSDDLDLIRTVK